MNMMLPDPCTGADIRRRLDVSFDWWARNWKRLVAEAGFPAPLPMFARPRKWDPVQVEAWIRRTHPADGAPAQIAANDAGDDGMAAELAARAAGLAGRNRRAANV